MLKTSYRAYHKLFLNLFPLAIHDGICKQLITYMKTILFYFIFLSFYFFLIFFMETTYS